MQESLHFVFMLDGGCHPLGHSPPPLCRIKLIHTAGAEVSLLIFHFQVIPSTPITAILLKPPLPFKGALSTTSLFLHIHRRIGASFGGSI
jgi:hypothetical protein